MASIKLKHSGGNGVIIAAPTSNPASDKTLTLPSDVDGTVVSKDSSNSLQNIAGINGGQLGNRRLTINGDMRIAQRGTSSTGTGYQTVDRFGVSTNGNDESPTSAQVDIASGTTPYTLGFRKALRMTNGNQTSGAGTPDIISVNYRLEAQDIANSGWNYTSSSSNITLSFWCKSSVAQNFFGHLKTTDGTAYNYPFETGSLSADTWTKITKTIQGNSNLQFDNDVNEGLKITWFQFAGTDRTASSATLNQWAAYDAAARTPDQTSTWYTTNDATFEITGVQLEVGSATDFEHRSFAVEERLCQRYYFRQSAEHQYTRYACHGQCPSANGAQMVYPLPVRMRAAPTFGYSALTDFYIYASNLQAKTPTSMAMDSSNTISPMFNANKSSTFTAGTIAHLTAPNNQQGYIEFIAEL